MHLLQGKRHGARLQASVKKIKEKNPSDLVRLHQINQQSVNHWKLKSIISRLISFNSHDLTHNSSECQGSLGRYSCKQQKWNHWRPFLMWSQCLIGPQDEIIQFGKLLKDRQVSFQTLAVNLTLVLNLIIFYGSRGTLTKYTNWGTLTGYTK